MTGNNQKSIEDCQNDLENIKNYIKANPLTSICQYLISYSVVRACGTIETIIKNIIFNHISNGANQEAINYFEKEILESAWNPSCGTIQRLLDKINPNWSIKFQATTSGTKYKMELNSLVNLRNEFAHGQKITATIDNIIDYYNGGCQIAVCLYNIINNLKN